MTKYRSYALVFALLSILACSKPSPEVKFEKLGVAFTCPEGWKVTDEEDIDGEGYYLTIEKDGFDASGLLTVSWTNDSLDLEEILDIYQEELENNVIYQNTNLAFDQTNETTFSKIPAQSRKYQVSLLGVAHEGYLYAFYGKNRTFAIIKQEAIEDQAKNQKGFEIIEGSFKSK